MNDQYEYAVLSRADFTEWQGVEVKGTQSVLSETRLLFDGGKFADALNTLGERGFRVIFTLAVCDIWGADGWVLILSKPCSYQHAFSQKKYHLGSEKREKDRSI
jgi:hypothetical protein